MKRIALLGIVAMMLVACNDHYDYDDDNNNEPAVNNNGGNNTNDNNQPPVDEVVRIEAYSCGKIAGWAQLADGTTYLQEVRTPAQCDGYEAGIAFNLRGPAVFTISGAQNVDVFTDANVELYDVEQNPYIDWSYPQLEIQIKSFYGLPPLWKVERFPTSLATAEGFKYATSSFICGMGLDMINQGCAYQFPGQYFKYHDFNDEAYFVQDVHGEIMVFGILY